MSIDLSNPNKEVQIREEYGDQRTGGHFAARSFDFSIAAETGWSNNDFSFPIPVSVFAAQVLGDSAWDGDEIEFCIAPDTSLGLISADVSVDDDVIDVGATAWGALKVGYYLKLDDGTNVDELGMVIEKQSDNKVKVETKAVHSFTAASTQAKMTVKMIPHGHLPSCSRLVIGDSKIGGTYIAANTTMRIRYNNANGAVKNFEFWLEYMY